MAEGATGAAEEREIALAVDLDGTLLRSDLLYDSFFDVLSRDFVGALRAVAAVTDGKAALKAALADRADIDPGLLPYDPEVLRLIEEARAAGRRVALVSASDQRQVQAVADHVGLFDEAHGSDGRRNLSGDAKAALLEERFGAGGFDYVGDGAVDLPVWRKAREALTVRAGPRLRAGVEAAAAQVRHIAPRRGGERVTALMRAARPHQWVKNLLVFLPAIAAHRFDADTLGVGAAAFLAFCLVASSVYILNDLLDLPADRAHPTKRRRPFASGEAKAGGGVALGAAMLAGGFAIGLGMGQKHFLAVLATYWIATLAYSLALKRRLVIDISVLAVLYTLRVMAGSAAVGLVLSPWLFAFSIFLFLSLAAIKRQAELAHADQRGESIAAGRAYRAEDQPIVAMIAISSGYMAVLVLALFVSGASTRALYESPLILWMVCPVLLFWVSRTVMLAHRGAIDEDPVLFALRDRVSLLSLAAIVLIALAAKFL